MEKLKSLHEIESMSPSAREYYFAKLHDYCQGLAEERKYKNNITATQKAIANITPNFNNYQFNIVDKDGNKLSSNNEKVKGVDKFPIHREGTVVVCNHSNSHDFFNVSRLLYCLGLPASVMFGVEGLLLPGKMLFESQRGIPIERTNKDSTSEGVYIAAARVIAGDTVVVFGEATWNLVLGLAMQNLHPGAIIIGCIARNPVSSAIMDSVEVPYAVKKESDLYSEVRSVGVEPLVVNPRESIIEQTEKLQKMMSDARIELWKKIKKETGIDRTYMDPEVYVNHTWLKKYGDRFFKFESENEIKFLYFKDGEPKIIELVIEDGKLVAKEGEYITRDSQVLSLKKAA